MVNFLKQFIKIFLIIIMVFMLFLNIIKINLYLLLGSLFISIITISLLFILYKNKQINIKTIKIVSIVLLIIGISIRIYLLITLKFNLTSDFELYYNTALEILNGRVISQADYLSYNGYVVVYSSILALIFKLFSSKIFVALFFNLVCQLGTMYFLYKLIKLLNDSYYKYILPSVWFILPTIIEANFLISTETLFIFLFSITIYYYLKIKNNNEVNIKNISKSILLGLLISFSNNIRPIMIIFIIALVIEFVLTNKNLKNLIFLIFTIITYMLCNIVFQNYCEYVLKENLRSGALAWSIYYGSSYEYDGAWNLEDSKKIGELLEESFNRYKNMGILKSSKLMIKKYNNLWTDNNGNYTFLVNITDESILNKIEMPLQVISYFITLILLIFVIIKKINNIKNDKMLLTDLFIIGYILSNLLIVVNGRYNYPIYLLLSLLIGCENGKGFDEMKEKISKLVNVYKKYGFIGFCKKLRAYIIANYLDKISFKVLLNKRKYRNIIKDILNTEKYDRIILWRSSFGYNVELFQRPQHIANNLAKQNSLVFYEVTTMTDNVKTLKKHTDNLYLINFNNIALNKILINELLKIDKKKYVQLYSTDWKLSIENIEDYISKGFGFIYEYIDHLAPELAGTKDLPKNIIDKYEYVMSHDNVYVVVTADLLKEDVIEKRGNKNLIYSSNGVDYNFFEIFDEDYKFESDFQNILNNKRPIIMYYGALAKWFDYELIKKIDKLNKYNIVLFGIKYDEAFDESGIDNLNNVFFLGPRDYKVLKNYAKHADVLTIPFVINDITKSTSPVKVFEYMALHKPIVTTDLLECRKYKSVFIGKNHEEFINNIEKALNMKNDKEYIQLLDKEARENDWSKKAKAIIDVISKDE